MEQKNGEVANLTEVRAFGNVDLYLGDSDQPGMTLISTPLTRNNYRIWSRFMRLALGAMGKLGFIDGKLTVPDKDSPDYERWKRVDCMVMCWILNCISKEISETFLCVSSARVLWLELENLFRVANGVLLYRLFKEIRSTSQGNMSVLQYFGKLKTLWGELQCLMPPPECSCGECTCGAAKAMPEIEQLMQFLMGLNDKYNDIRNQILMMDPLPSVDKAYTMVRSIDYLAGI